MGYAKDKRGTLKRQFGWLNHEGGQNRLNVAITRAKEKIYFVSSLYPEQFKVEDLNSEGPKLLKDFMRYCYYISNQNYDAAKTVLNSLHKTEETTVLDLTNQFVVEIKERLEKNGYMIKTQIGIGKYHIDLGVYDEVSQSYLLGIICDIKQEDTINSRNDLLHQERYLSARKWQIYRVFQSNWYENPQKEIKNIKDLIKNIQNKMSSSQ